MTSLAPISSAPAAFSTKRNFANLVYWIGVILTAACILLVLIGQSEVFHAVEHNDFPLSWVFAALAVVAFTVAEVSQHSASDGKLKTLH